MSKIKERRVTIPACVEHEGYHALNLTLPWVCIYCGAPRGEPHVARSYDGSRVLEVDSWVNTCGHIEMYSAIREWMALPVIAANPQNEFMVLNEHTLGYVSAREPDLFCVLRGMPQRGGHDWKNGSVSLSRLDQTRLASFADFHDYRVSSMGHVLPHRLM